ncbi:DNA gyrase subunit B [Mesomycoplasma conjunctivae]|uniref:DNA topoisomerase (ATP-hydrolyzing) n=1 Tax=Mesomycoplasma conjunctivae (strain ATCC 25834 / NCTC 10147 / HRC/581) TaxID=572263 RepID=C5J6X3_MESCH|nr:type IIA DNA topoisomerase subunit B [Mesomycoplasma conjunctivae]CAT05236.1 Topoisomerase IV subunit B [Mesomycoplasma conjunctivae]VEU66457.1 DNA gyrase subunit B [Mesomycoplasma conjunctivae]
MEYSAEKLKVLKGLEAVRKRPGMYIGSTDIGGLHHLIWEIFDNAVDEAIAGFATEIKLILKKDNSIEISDNGRGIPVDKHKSGKTGVELVFSELHAGGKFSNDVYKTAAGLHGVGSSVVNALSSKLEVWVYRDGYSYFTSFKNGGHLDVSTQKVEKSKNRGTTVRFWPDFSIFSQTSFSSDIISERLRETSFLVSNLKISFYNEISNENEIFFFQKGLISFVEFINVGKSLVHKDVVFLEGESQGIQLEVALQYVSSYQDTIISFVNNVKTDQGGTHENGFRGALLRAITTYGQQKSLLKAKTNLEFSDVKQGLSAILSLRVPEPILEFVGQTKNKLSTLIAKSVTEEIIYNSLMTYFVQNKEDAAKIITHVNNSYQERISAKLAKIENKTSKNISKEKRILSGKLTPAQSKNAKEREIFLVEGESAGGSAKLGRNRFNQAILPLKGKIVNAEKTKLIDLLKNEEIIAIVSALGTGLGVNFNLKNLNYDKIIIMTDADTDGAHIQILILTFIFRYMKPLIENGHVYIAQPPLYKLSYKNKDVRYAWDEKELAKLLAKKPNAQIQRYKGLGEMNAAQLWETTMDPKTRSLVKVSINDIAIVERRIFTLMGDKTDIRKTWIEKNVDFSLEDSFLDRLKIEDELNYEN